MSQSKGLEDKLNANVGDIVRLSGLSKTFGYYVEVAGYVKGCSDRVITLSCENPHTRTGRVQRDGWLMGFYTRGDRTYFLDEFDNYEILVKYRSQTTAQEPEQDLS